jgi:hypothetical protein
MVLCEKREVKLKKIPGSFRLRTFKIIFWRTLLVRCVFTQLFDTCICMYQNLKCHAEIFNFDIYLILRLFHKEIAKKKMKKIICKGGLYSELLMCGITYGFLT